MRRFISMTAAAALFALAPALAQAGDYPERTVSVIVPFPPGGSVDGVARIVVDKLNQVLGPHFIVENRAGGASGNVGANVVAKADADGYTLLLTASLHVVSPFLYKSVPFDVDETVVSWMRQAGREGNLEVVTAVARQRIIREYEEILNSLGAGSAVVLSSTLASLPLLEDRGATLLVRMSGKSLTTVIVQGANLCVYRSTDMPADAGTLDPQAMLDEIFPAIAYHQDTWDTTVDRVRVSGFGQREGIFQRALAEEIKCPVAALAESEAALTMGSHAKDLMHQDLDALVGWNLNAGA